MIAILNFQPQRFAELKERVKQGRVELVNAFFLESTINLSGGEPTLHPQFLEFLDMARERKEISRVSISTNGLRVATDLAFCEELAKRKVYVSLQLDALSAGPDSSGGAGSGRAGGVLLGDLLAVSDLDARWNMGYRRGWLTVGLVVHGGSPLPGHGPGITPILTGPAGVLQAEPDLAGHAGLTEAAAQVLIEEPALK